MASVPTPPEFSATPEPAGSSKPPGPGSAAAGSSGPVLTLLARGLELWLRQQCDAIGDLHIELEGSAAQLLWGRLQAVRLQARRVVFQRLEIERVELRSDPLQVRMGRLLRSQGLELDHPFRIEGAVTFSAEGLSHCLATPPWSALGDSIAEQLLGLTPLAGLRFEGDRLILRSQVIADGLALERRTRLLIDDGGLVLQADPDPDGGAAAALVGGFSSDDAKIARLPKDDNIRFQAAEVGGGLLELQGQAWVSP